MVRAQQFLIILSLIVSASYGINRLVPVRAQRQPTSSPTKEFGQFGRDGQQGIPGNNGSNGDKRVIFALGKRIEVDVSGVDGENGQEGMAGENALCTPQPFPIDFHLRGASGGNGADGGDGGNGGDAGSVTIYYQNPKDLAQIKINAAGGKGGRGGIAGAGGLGCLCTQLHWQQQICRDPAGELNYSCRVESFTCHDGINGRAGRDGQNGSDGLLGHLTLIKSTSPLPPSRVRAEITVASFIQQPLLLSLNQWRFSEGALSLLATGSIISDKYREFIGRQEFDFRLVWNAPQSWQDFGTEKVDVALSSAGTVEVLFPEDVWTQSQIWPRDSITEFEITYALRENEARQLTRADFTGNYSQLKLVLVDLARKSDVLTTEFQIKYRSATDREGKRFQIRYEGEIPSTLVSRSGQRFILEIGKLPGLAREFLKPGLPIGIELIITRSLGERSTIQTINWEGTIR